MKLFYKIFGTAMIAAAAAASCTDLDNLEQRIDSLESRIAAIEAQLDGFNDNIEALGAFAEGNRTISNVAENNGVYTITLSDNTTITLDQGSTAATPVVTVDENKYWMVDYKDGNGPQYLLNSAGEKVQAGTTPLFGVDEYGYWTVSYDDGETYVQVTDPSGNPVSAVNDEQTQDSFFKDVAYNEAEGTFTVILLDDRTFTLPVVPGFVCAIENVEGAQVFELNETKTYPMTVNGESEMTVFKPEGWTAIVSENAGAYTLSVTAPAQATTLTKAVIADSRSDISVLAISSTGFAAMAKMQVELSEAPIPATATVTAVTDAATETSLTYTVSPDERTDSWKYIHQLATEPAPTAETQGWIDGTETTVVINELSANTEYTLYVLPYREDTPGTVASATQRTAKKVYGTKLDEYNNEGAIEIAGVVYTKEEFGEAVHVTASAPGIATSYAKEGDARIYFVDPDANATYDYTGAVMDMIIVGNSNTERSKLTMTNDDAGKANYIKLNQGTAGYLGRFVVSNIEIDATGFASYLITNNANNAFEYVMMDNCRIRMQQARPMINITVAERSIRNFTMQNCEYEITAANQNMVFSLQSSSGNCEADFENITFDNNLFYSNSTTATSNFKLVYGQKAGIGNLTITNNTFINTITQTTFYVYIDRVSNVNITRNIAWTDQTMANNCGFLRALTTWPTGTTVAENIVYKGTNEKNWQIFFDGTKYMFEGAEQFNILTDDPFSGTGASFDIPSATFVPNSTYSSYGVQPVE